jgi:hypothetical protein
MTDKQTEELGGAAMDFIKLVEEVKTGRKKP